ncbi:MAG: MmgE/PrpD family protein [Roseovarius sp.]
MSLTDTLLELAQRPAPPPDTPAQQLARLSLLDWITCGVAGQAEPVAQHLRQFAQAEASQAQAQMFGHGAAPARMAALVNGATSHALDYDDTHFAHVGHLSVGIYPAALAVAQHMDAPARDMITAFLMGAEGAIRIGLVLGKDHYQMGFHQTATAGAFGATLAAGRLYGLTDPQMRAALGLCATRASGLKSQFGTMGKPYNAGVAASNGVECAQLAQLGLSAPEDGILGPQGFVDTHAPGGPVSLNIPAGQYLFEDNKYKLHACCHGTHAMIEALLVAQKAQAFSLPDIRAIALRTNPRWLRVCDNKAPRTGLEVKFSYGWLAGMTLRGDATDHDRTYVDALATDHALLHFAERVQVTGDDTLSDMQAAGELHLVNGTTLPFAHDLKVRITPSDLRSRLHTKAETMLGFKGTEIWALHDVLDQMQARDFAQHMIAP